MSESSQPTDRVEELFWKHLDGSLNPSEEAELQKLLEEHPEHGRALFAMADEHLALEEALRASAIGQEAATEPKRAGKQPSSKRIRRISTHRLRALRRRRPAAAFGTYAAVAACLALTVTVFFALQNRPTTAPANRVALPNPPVPVDHDAVAGSTVIARVVRVEPQDVAQNVLPLVHAQTGNQAILAGQTICAGDRIETGTATITVRYIDEATLLDLAVGSSLQMSLRNGAKRLTLDQGELTAEVAKQPEGKSFTFATPFAEATVLGTRFKLTVGKDFSQLEVLEGRVRFAQADDRSVIVNGGECAIASATDLRMRDVAVTDEGLSEKLVPSKGCLLGVSINVRKQKVEDAAELTALEEKLGRKMAIAHQFHAFSDTNGDHEFPTACEKVWANDGRLLLLSWKPRLGNTQLKWSDIAAGTYDAEYVDPAARKLAAWGQKVFLALHHQPDDDVHGEGSGMSAADFVAMWRHVRERFDAAGAKNVVWVWTVIAGTRDPERWNQLYPGDDCVDWIACGAYNAGGDQWRSLTQATQAFYSWSVARFSGDRFKPIMFNCIGCAENPTGPPTKEEWLSGLPAELAAMPNVKAVIYWSSRLDVGGKFSLDSSHGALLGFRAAGLDPYLNPEIKPHKRR